MQVQLSARKLKMPSSCACCGETADSTHTAVAVRTTGKRVIHHTSRSWEFPYCGRCKQHASVWEDAAAKSVLAKTFMFVFIVAGAALYFTESVAAIVTAVVIGAGSLIVAAGFVLAARAGQKRAKGMTAASCATPAYAVEYEGWNGSVQQFQIVSASFAESLATLNESKLVGGFVPPPRLAQPPMALRPGTVTDDPANQDAQDEGGTSAVRPPYDVGPRLKAIKACLRYGWTLWLVYVDPDTNVESKHVIAPTECDSTTVEGPCSYCSAARHRFRVDHIGVIRVDSANEQTSRKYNVGGRHHP